MATKKKSEKSSEVATDSTDRATLPKGFDEVDIDGGPQNWWSVEKGATIQGELLGAFQRRVRNPDDEGKVVFKVRLTAPTNAIFQKEEIELAPGDTVCFDGKSGFQDAFKALADDPKNRWEIYLHAIDRERIQGTNRTFWRFAKGKKLLGKKLAPPRNDDVPF